ncbi:hypothetical protein [Planomicrobium okeanokoites]|uniref:hypothetical protein n=1 Tax=Planomicrobium okeanokoites TaxID=244 RepID=UPI000A0212AD|nr:hypothetical protein [Planomicrobium okeanokoites]
MKTTKEQFKEKVVSISLSGAKSLQNTEKIKKPKEKLSRRELEELMGMNRETYQKQGGAYRRKR